MKKLSVVFVVVASAIMATTASAQDCPEGMVSYWKLDETSGTTAVDSYGSNDGIIHNSQLQQPGKVGYGIGMDTGGLPLDPENTDNIQVADDASLRFGSGDFSIEVWVNLDIAASGHAHSLVVKREDFDLYRGYSLWVIGEEIRGQLDFGAPWYEHTTTSASLAAGTWYHIVWVVDRANSKSYFYVDGSAVDSPDPINSAASIAHSDPLYIGIGGGTSAGLIGTIDEVALYNRALTSDEIQQHYQNGLDGLGYCEPANKPPIADASPDQTVIIGATVQLDGSGSYDPDEEQLTYDWVITTKPAGSSAELSDAMTVNPTFVADISGVYTVGLTVSDGIANSEPDEVVITAQTPEEAAQYIIEDVAAQDALNGGQSNALTSKLERAIEQVDRGKTKTAVNQFRAFVNHVASLIEEGVLSAADGQALIDAANAITARFGGVATKLAVAPAEFSLSQPCPNPFNPSTTIHYTLPEASDVRLTIHSSLGQEVRVLINASQGAGDHSVHWAGTDAFGREVTSGVYLYRLEAGDYVAVRKMVLVK